MSLLEIFLKYYDTNTFCIMLLYKKHIHKILCQYKLNNLHNFLVDNILFISGLYIFYFETIICNEYIVFGDTLH